MVSHRANINLEARKQGRDRTSGQLHNDTAYGLTAESLNGVPLVVGRKPIDSLTPAMIEKIRDPHLARLLTLATKGKEGRDLKAAIGQPPAPLQHLARKVQSGDSGNAEAQAARIYWPMMIARISRATPICLTSMPS